LPRYLCTSLMNKKRKFPRCSNQTDSELVRVKKVRPNHLTDCQRALFECSDYWEDKFLAAKKLNKGGSVTIQQPFFPPSLATPLWNLLAPHAKPHERLLMTGPQIEGFNLLFGDCVYGKSGWCFANYPNRQENWNVKRILVSYSLKSGLLKLVFDTEKSNWRNEAFTFRESITSKKTKKVRNVK